MGEFILVIVSTNNNAARLGEQTQAEISMGKQPYQSLSPVNIWLKAISPENRHSLSPADPVIIAGFTGFDDFQQDFFRESTNPFESAQPVFQIGDGLFQF